jgi:hypothetical protein
MKTNPMTICLTLVMLGLTGFCAWGEPVSTDRIKRLIAEMQSDNEQLALAATIDLTGLGEEGLGAVEKIMVGFDRDWMLYKEIVGKVRKSTRVTVHGEKGKAMNAIREIAKQADVDIYPGIASVEARLIKQEINLDVENVYFWSLMESICRPANISPGITLMGELNFSLQPLTSRSSIIAGDWVCLKSIEKDQKLDYNEQAPPNSRLKLQFQLLPDPKRMGLLAKGEYRIDKATDDQGNTYVQDEQALAPAADLTAGRSGPPGTPAGFPLPLPINRVRMLSLNANPVGSATIVAPGTPGKKLSVRGAALLYGTAVEIKKLDIAKLGLETHNLGGCKLSFEKGNAANQLTFKILIKDDQKNNSQESMAQVLQMMLQNCVWIEDEEGAKQRMSVSSSSVGIGEASVTLRQAPAARNGLPLGKPSKFLIVMPTDLKQISVPFEFKDIPLP